MRNKKGFLVEEAELAIFIGATLVLLMLGFYSANIQAKLYNQKYGTEYTTWDFLKY